MAAFKDHFDEYSIESLKSSAKSLFNLAVSNYRDELVPWKEFAAVFKSPQLNARHIEQRVTSNFEQYRVNYVVICLGVFALRMIFSPVFLITTILVFTFSIYLLLLHKKTLKIGDTVLNSNHKRILCAATGVFLFFLSGTLETLVWCAIYCFFICGLHLVFRPRNVSVTRSNKSYDAVGSGASASGMNSFDPEGGAGGSYGDDSNMRRRGGNDGSDVGAYKGAAMYNVASGQPSKRE